MKRPLLLALVLAIPLEAANFLLYPFPVDVGLPSDAGWFTQVMCTRWLLLHWLGLRIFLVARMTDTFLLPITVLGGYVEVALLMWTLLLLIRWIMRSRRPADA